MDEDMGSNQEEVKQSFKTTNIIAAPNKI